MVDPLPELGAADLGGGGVFHEVEERDAADATQPGFEVAEAYGDVLLQAGEGDGAEGDGEKVGGGAVVVGELLGDLVGLRHDAVEDFERDGDEAGMRDPGAVVSVGGFAFLVGADASEGALVSLGVGLDGDERRHAAHGGDVAAVAGLDAELAVSQHEGRGHGDLRAVGEEHRFVSRELFDEAEDVVPAAAVEACRVVAEFVEDLVHLEGGEDRFDQDGGADAALRDVEERLGANEDVVPETRLEVRLHLGQVEVGAGAAGEEFGCVVEEVEREVEDAAGHCVAVDQEVALFEMPAACADKEDGGVFFESVLLLGVSKVMVRRTASRRLNWPSRTLCQVGGGGVLEVGHGRLWRRS